MSNVLSIGPSRNLRRKAVTASQEDLVRTAPLFPGERLPLMLQPAVDGVDLITWATDQKQQLEDYLLHHGGILFRDFGIYAVERFESLITALTGSLLPYEDRTAPRHSVHGNVYTSTDLPADRVVLQHNECSYSDVWPRKIFFVCVLPAEEGGSTPIADCRRIYQRLTPALRDRFEEKGVMYVRNYHEGIGLPWQEVFQTHDRATLEAFCRASRIEYEWIGSRLRTRQIRPGVARHPTTGEPVWFNQALVFHPAMQPPEVRRELELAFAPEDLPTNACYGDGAPIDDATVEEITAAYDAETRSFPWQKGDVLLLDNFLATHGRAPFRGPRKILVGMGNPCTLDDIGFVPGQALQAAAV